MRLRRLVALVLPARGVGAAPTPMSPNGAHEDDDFSDCEGDKMWEVEQQGSITLKNKKERKWWSWMQWCRKELQPAFKNASTNRRHKHERGREATAAWLWLVVQMALLHLGAVLYWWSLEGQPSLEVLHDNLARLVAYLLTSVVSFLAAFLYSSPSSSSNCSTCGGAGKRKVSARRAAALWWWIRLAVRLYGAGLIWWMLWQDRGNTLEHHGGFNILAFMAFFLPSLSLSLATRFAITTGSF